ncbi:DNA polymerase III subunit delta' [Myxococcus sp. AM010]|uniref:DNA polymerase III subunit delta' n=1 Tax=Myxococcus sp. AM010 TaxID=2745138 RepID=UPI0015962BD5|nr:DNA polymerase III subunit delta' [Myxococcus sp. AM010]NVJ14839.1 DNA polymerase III subunit delta' [Myxococcus sp. AM010]
MTLATVLGQPRAVDALQAALRSGAVHHAYLFAGPEGVGKELAAVGLAQALTCPEQPDVGCGACESCQRVARGLHPDVTWVMPDDERVSRGLAGRSDFTGTPSRELRVEQVRQLQERIALRGLESRRKVALIVSAQTMNVQAQNAFLKTLEEPPSDTTLILVASAMDRLLPTIRSRCGKVHFGPLPVDLVAQRVAEARKLDAETAKLAAVMAGGSLGRAMALDVAALSRRKDIVTAFETLRGEDAVGLLRFAEAHGGSREEAESTLELLALWTRDVALVKAGLESGLANRDLVELARQVAGRTSDILLHRRHSLMEAARAGIARNGAPRLQMERMLIDLFTETSR